MDIIEYFGASTGRFPESSCAEVGGPWMELGAMTVPVGDLWAGPFCPTDPAEGCVVTVVPGSYLVSVKGMDFKGHRRMARARVCASGIQEPVLGKSFDEINVDGGTICLCDITAFGRTVTADYTRQYEKEIFKTSQSAFFESYGTKIATLSYGGQTVDIAFMPAGFGDGTYAVFPLLCAGKSVGIEVGNNHQIDPLFLAKPFRVLQYIGIGRLTGYQNTQGILAQPLGCDFWLGPG